jgi:hypothetical protein
MNYCKSEKFWELLQRTELQMKRKLAWCCCYRVCCQRQPRRSKTLFAWTRKRWLQRLIILHSEIPVLPFWKKKTNIHSTENLLLLSQRKVSKDTFVCFVTIFYVCPHGKNLRLQKGLSWNLICGNFNVEFGVLTALLMMNFVSWDIAPSSTVCSLCRLIRRPEHIIGRHCGISRQTEGHSFGDHLISESVSATPSSVIEASVVLCSVCLWLLWVNVQSACTLNTWHSVDFQSQPRFRRNMSPSYSG